MTVSSTGVDFHGKTPKNLPAERPSSIVDGGSTSAGINFRIYGNKLQYKATNSSSWTSLLE